MFKRVHWSQSERKHVYCDGDAHLTVINPLSPHSGHPHELSLSDCDCVKPEPVESEGGEA